GYCEGEGDCRFSSLSGDGSDRSFFRIKTAEDASFIGVLPPTQSGSQKADKGKTEALASYNIGKHLQSRGIPVPEIIDFDPQSGALLFEDLGDTLLHDILPTGSQEKTISWPTAKDIYMEIVETLLFMQISGSVRFNRKWCWDTQRYDKKLMLEKESGYFTESFCRQLLGIENFAPGLADEFKLLAGRAGRQPAVYFLHRDFQSRNIMICNDEARIIDFQGGRLGPLGYDLASLLIDPYAALPEDLQQELLEHYLYHLCKYGLDDLAFLKGYTSLAIQRNLQILGAFAFLSHQKEKVFFRQYLKPAALSLYQRLATKDGEDYPCLRSLTEESLNLLEKSDSGSLYKGNECL
ncbi:MAG: phosphotransferase, partial [Proteobacteria bacterium]|nr:phosphotransferase [Pseudomonadota bacterium]